MHKGRRVLTLFIITLFLSACGVISSTTETIHTTTQTTSISLTLAPTTGIETTSMSETTTSATVVSSTIVEPTTDLTTSIPLTTIPLTTLPPTSSSSTTTTLTQIIESELLDVRTNISDGSVTLSKQTPLLGDFLSMSANVINGYEFEHWQDMESGLIVSMEREYSFTLSAKRSFKAMYLPEGMAELYCYSSNETAVIRDITGPVTSGTLVTIQAEATEESLFVSWYDLIQKKDISTDNPLTLSVSESRYLVAVYATKVSDFLAYSTGFEDASKSAYLEGLVESEGDFWKLSDSLIGALDSDQKMDLKSVRMKAGYLETQFALPSVTEISFHYGQYGIDAAEVLSVFVSTNQSNWILLEEVTSDSSFKTFSFSLTDAWYQDNSLMPATELYLKISGLAATRTNIDNVSIFQHNYQRQELPVVFLRPETEYTGYYEGIGGLGGEDLVDALRAILWDGFAMLTYGEARTILDETDADPSNSANVILVYLGTSVSGAWDSGITWNREHVWPQSFLGAEADNYVANVASDLHNLKPADPYVNSVLRNNKYYDIITNSDSYEPRDEVKGDVARILFYMAVMYDYLHLVNENPGLYEMAMLDVLLDWHVQDEVDDFERHRNDVIYSYQKNRNPFIDHPELVDLIWVEESSLPIS